MLRKQVGAQENKTDERHRLCATSHHPQRKTECQTISRDERRENFVQRWRGNNRCLPTTTGQAVTNHTLAARITGIVRPNGRIDEPILARCSELERDGRCMDSGRADERRAPPAVAHSCPQQGRLFESAPVDNYGQLLPPVRAEGASLAVRTALRPGSNSAPVACGRLTWRQVSVSVCFQQGPSIRRQCPATYLLFAFWPLPRDSGDLACRRTKQRSCSLGMKLDEYCLCRELEPWLKRTISGAASSRPSA